MAQIRGDNAKLYLNGQEIGVTEWQLDLAPLEEKARKPSEVIAGLRGLTFHGVFIPTPAYDAFVVGLSLQYGLRELHRNLARLAAWPYTN